MEWAIWRRGLREDGMLMEWMSKTLKLAKSIGRIRVILLSATETAIGDHVVKLAVAAEIMHTNPTYPEDILPYFTSLYLVIANFWHEAAS
jgi:hypothetical protein